MTGITQNITQIKKSIPKHVTLVAVSKTKPNQDILQAYQGGQRIFGENKVQEMTQKWEALPKDIQWHMIGHVQRNKVKYMAPYVHLIHGVDSFKLLQEINKQAKKNNRVIDCLLQMHVAQEQTKFGMDQKEIEALVLSDAFSALENIRITGIMGMASFTQNTQQITQEFKTLKNCFEHIKQLPLNQSFKEHFTTLSMGMSNDYPIAITQGSTMIRVGSSIFGKRNYTL